MTTQLLAARSGLVTQAMSAAAKAEGVSAEKVMEEIALGRAVLPANPRHGNLRPLVAGRAFRTKVNANIGLSPEKSSRDQELVKLRAALDANDSRPRRQAFLHDSVFAADVRVDYPACHEVDLRHLRQCRQGPGKVDHVLGLTARIGIDTKLEFLSPDKPVDAQQADI